MTITSMDTLMQGYANTQKLVFIKTCDAGLVAPVTPVPASAANQMISLYWFRGQPYSWADGASTASGIAPIGVSPAYNAEVGTALLGNLSTSAGTIPLSTHAYAAPFNNPIAPQKSYIAGIYGSATIPGSLVVYDMLWSWTSSGSGAGTSSWASELTAAQNTVGPLPLTRPDSSGVNTELWLEKVGKFRGGTGPVAGTSTVTYTNSAGVANRTATATIPAGIPPLGQLIRYRLDAGDTGVRSVQSIIGNNGTSGLISTVTNTFGSSWRLQIVRRVVEVPCPSGGFVYNAIDVGLPQVYDNAHLGVAYIQSVVTTSAMALQATLQLVQA